MCACGGGSSPAGSNLSGEINVGAPESLTGNAAFAGTQILEGLQLAADEVNSTKFLGGATIKLKSVDVSTAPQTGVTVVRQLIEQDHVAAVVGLVSSAQTPAIAPIAQGANVPLIVAGGAVPGVTSTRDYITSTNLNQYVYADKMGQALKKLNITTTEILYSQDIPTITTLVHTYTDQVFPKYGIKATLKAYLATDTDLSGGITQGVAAKVDSIGCLFVGAQGTTCLSQARNAGFTGPLWGQQGFDGGTALKAGSVADGLIYTTEWSRDFTYPASKKLVQLYAAKFPSKIPSSFQAAGYDAVWLLARAIKAGNGGTRDAIHAGLLKVLAQGMDGAHGPMTWDKDRNLVGPGAVVQVKNGQESLFL
jgi:branched-chain amino acid transport system substrate-binding protein